jgi:hypothetical protein
VSVDGRCDLKDDGDGNVHCTFCQPCDIKVTTLDDQLDFFLTPGSFPFLTLTFFWSSERQPTKISDLESLKEERLLKQTLPSLVIERVYRECRESAHNSRLPRNKRKAE